MAKVRTGPLAVDVRGSIGDVTWSRNRGGLYTKARVAPENKNTLPQQYARRALALLSISWSDVLDHAEREAWKSYAHGWPQPNTWGTPTNTNGYTRFIQVNLQYARMNAQDKYPDLPDYSDILRRWPPMTGPLSPPIITVTAQAGPDVVEPWLPPANYNPPNPTFTIYAYQSKPVPGGRSYPTPWRTAVLTNEYVPPWAHEPWTWVSPYPLVEGQRIWCWFTAQCLFTGALSTPYLATTIVTAAS
jgi:hypothetical protein